MCWLNKATAVRQIAWALLTTPCKASPRAQPVFTGARAHGKQHGIFKYRRLCVKSHEPRNLYNEPANMLPMESFNIEEMLIEATSLPTNHLEMVRFDLGAWIPPSPWNQVLQLWI